MDKLVVGLIAGVGMVAVIVVLALFGAFTISTLWGWFMLPLGVKSIGMAQAYGLSLMVSVFMGNRGLSGESESKTVILQGVMINIIALIFGGIAVNFM